MISVVGAERVDAVCVLAAGLASCRDRRGVAERLAAVEELAVNLRLGADPQGVALAAPYGHALVERGPLGGLQLGGAEEVRDLDTSERKTGVKSSLPLEGG